MQTQLNLKEKLLKNKISKTDFLSELAKLDQSTDLHEECINNIEVLEQNEVKNIFLDSDSKIAYMYYQDLRNFYFHAFQLLVESDKNGAMKNLEKAAKLAPTLKELDPTDYDLFTPYIQATLYYMCGDLNNLKLQLDFLEKADKNDVLYSNVTVVSRLYEGLQKYKNVDYSRDY